MIESAIAIAIDWFTLRLRDWTTEFHGKSEMRYKLCLMGEIQVHEILVPGRKGMPSWHITKTYCM
jgi:hypothetical protein